MTLPIYRIRDWDELYEWHSTRSRPTDPMRWVKLPTKHGTGYVRLVTGNRRGGAHYGAWCAMLSVAGTCFPRGVLVDTQGNPYTALTLSLKTRLPSRDFEELIPRLLDAEVGWLETITPEELAASRAQMRAQVQPGAKRVPDKTEQDRTLPDKTKQQKPRLPARPVDDEFLEELQSGIAYKKINVRVEYEKMVLWCNEHGKMPSRRRFLRWLTYAERPMEVTGGPDRPSGGPSGNSPHARKSDTLRKRDYGDVVNRSLAGRSPRDDNEAAKRDRESR